MTKMNNGIVGGGIKCDNVNCDFVDETVLISDYKEWLNKPCPKCGCNLLTQEDYDAVMLIMDICNEIPEEYNVSGDENDVHKITFNFDGSGNPDMTIE